MPSLPELFQKPEAVLGIVMAAAALLVDFARNLARLAARTSPTPNLFKSDLQAVESSIADLQTALNTSKSELTRTERQLDDTLARANSTEAAIAAMDDTRTAISNARRQAADAYSRLIHVRDTLNAQTSRRDDTVSDISAMRRERDRLATLIDRKEDEVTDLQARLASARESQQTYEANSQAESAQREQILQDEIRKREDHLDQVQAERDRVAQEAAVMSERVDALEEEAATATTALTETRLELARVAAEVDEREEEITRVEFENTQALKQSEEAGRLKQVVSGMERELGDLQGELRERDQVVRDVEKESDQLRSLLAARDAELQELSSRLQSAISAEKDTGGDSRVSDSNLEDIKSSLDSEQLALAADIARAELASLEINEGDLDPLDRLSLEMGAEGDRLQSSVMRAETALKRDTSDRERKDGAVREILDSVTEEESSQDEEVQWPPLYPDNDQLGELASPQAVSPSAGVDKQNVDVQSASEKPGGETKASGKKEGDARERKPRKPSSRKKNAGGTDSGSGEGDGGQVRRKRGRPKKRNA